MKKKDFIIEKLIKNEEDMLKGVKLNHLTDTEQYYLSLAKIIPYHLILKDLEYYKKNWYKIDEIKYINELMKKYSCTKTELYDRIYIIQKINHYKSDCHYHKF